MIKFMKYIEKFILNIFQIIFGKKNNKKVIYLNDTYNILIIIKGNISDTLMATPLIKIIKENSGAEISVLLNKDSEEVVKYNKAISHTFCFKDNLYDILKLLIKLKKHQFDVIINLNENYDLNSTFNLAVINAKYKIGFSNITPKLLTHPIETSAKLTNHKVDRLLKLTDAFSFYYSKKHLNIIYQTKSSSELSISNFLKDKNIGNKFSVCINVSNYDDNRNNWNVDNYKNLVKYLSNFDINIIITSSVYDIENAEKAAIKNSITFYNTDFDEYAALLNHCDFIFTPDSYTVHLAAAFNKPVFIIFCEDDEMLHVPYNSDFDFVLSEKKDLSKLSYGKVLNSFIPYFEYVYERYGNKI